MLVHRVSALVDSEHVLAMHGSAQYFPIVRACVYLNRKDFTLLTPEKNLNQINLSLTYLPSTYAGNKWTYSVPQSVVETSIHVERYDISQIKYRDIRHGITRL